MKNIFKVLGAGIGIFLLVIFGLNFIFSSVTPSCGENSDAVKYALSLSSQRLERLYKDMERFSTIEDAPLDGYHKYSEKVFIPEEFADLKVVKIRPLKNNIMVEGCMDEYVYLDFKGIKSKKEKQEIWLRHPFHLGTPYEQKSVKLWSQ